MRLTFPQYVRQLCCLHFAIGNFCWPKIITDLKSSLHLVMSFLLLPTYPTTKFWPTRQLFETSSDEQANFFFLPSINHTVQKQNCEKGAISVNIENISRISERLIHLLLTVPFYKICKNWKRVITFIVHFQRKEHKLRESNVFYLQHKRWSFSFRNLHFKSNGSQIAREFLSAFVEYCKSPAMESVLFLRALFSQEQSR